MASGTINRSWPNRSHVLATAKQPQRHLRHLGMKMKGVYL